jgi:hypothetical protein
MRPFRPLLGLLSVFALLAAVPSAAPSAMAGASLSELPLLPLAAVSGDLGLPLVVAQKKEVKPLAAVLKTIDARIPGRALDARLNDRDDGKSTYRVKWLGDDGKVREITADAGSGKILRVR